MKRRICMLLILSTCVIGNAAAEGTFVADKDTRHNIDDIRSLVFKDDIVKTNFINGDMIEYDFSSMQRLYFTEDSDEKENVNNIVTDTELRLYPNPVTDRMTITGLANDNMMVTVYNISGKAVLTTTSDDETVYIDASSLPTGIYYVSAGDKCVKFIKK